LDALKDSLKVPSAGGAAAIMKTLAAPGDPARKNLIVILDALWIAGASQYP
jgi:hypothetical protein